MGLLKSKLFAGDARLEACAVRDSSHLTLGTIGPFVAKVQSALQLIENATISDIELKEQRYGQSTANAVLAFKAKRSIINPAYQRTPDNIVGKMTIATLDAEMVEIERRNIPPPPPTPPAPKPLEFEEAKKSIRGYLQREAKHNVAELLLRKSENLLVFGEVHFAGDPMKAFLFSELTARIRVQRPINTHFHASERFMNDQNTRQQISDMLSSSPFGMEKIIPKLSEDLRPFIPVLAAANSYPGRRFGVIPGNSASAPEDQRHKTIFEAFNNACDRCPDVPLRSIQSTTSRGHFLLGARHAARRSIIGSAAATTCARLISAGWRVHTMRLTWPDEWQQQPTSMEMRLVGSQDTRIIRALDIIRTISDRNFYADITKPDSPFAQLKFIESGAREIPVNSLFDAIVHLGGPASL